MILSVSWLTSEELLEVEDEPPIEILSFKSVDNTSPFASKLVSSSDDDGQGVNYIQDHIEFIEDPES